MRIVRFVGAGRIWWPVGMHNMLVADLLPQVLKVHGLLHDAGEVVSNDVPQPFKTAETKVIEGIIDARMYANLGLTLPTPEQHAIIKEADMKAVCAEGTLGCGPYAFPLTQRKYYLDANAQRCLEQYLEEFKPSDAIDPDGRWAYEYEDRIREAIRWQREYTERRNEQERFFIKFNIKHPELGSEVRVPGLRATAKPTANKKRRPGVVLSDRARSATKRAARKAR